MSSAPKSYDSDYAKLRVECEALGEQVKQLHKTEKRLYDTQNSLDLQIKRIRALNQFSLEATQTLEINEIFTRALDLIHSQFDFDVSISLSCNDNMIEPVAIWGDENDRASWLRSDGKGVSLPLPGVISDLRNCVYVPYSEAIELTGPFLIQIEKLIADKFEKRLFQKINHCILLLLPLRNRHDQLLGLVVAGVSSSKPTPYRNALPTQNDLPLFNLSASHIETALENAILHKKTLALADGLRGERDAADDANQAKSIFLANISHELRTPMHGILSFARFGRQSPEVADKSALKEYFDEIYASGNHLMKLLNDLLDLAKLEAGKMEYSITNADLFEIATSAKNELKAFAEEKGIVIELHSTSTTALGDFDGERIRQVLNNLLSNAIKFTKGQQPVQMKVSGTESKIICHVINQGIEIPEDELKLIFDKFVQSSKTRNGAGGTGLGLAICKEIIEHHGGKIWAENKSGGSVHFTFEIPREVTILKSRK